VSNVKRVIRLKLLSIYLYFTPPARVMRYRDSSRRDSVA